MIWRVALSICLLGQGLPLLITSAAPSDKEPCCGARCCQSSCYSGGCSSGPEGDYHRDLFAQFARFDPRQRPCEQPSDRSEDPPIRIRCCPPIDPAEPATFVTVEVAPWPTQPHPDSPRPVAVSAPELDRSDAPTWARAGKELIPGHNQRQATLVVWRN